MPLTRITATLGAVALGGVLVASTAGVGASASVDHQRPDHARAVVHHRFVAPAPHAFRPHSNLRMGLHCGTADTSM